MSENTKPIMREPPKEHAMKRLLSIVLPMVVFLITTGSPMLFAAEPDAALKAKLEAKFAEIRTWAADPAIGDAVASANASPSAEAKAMTQDKWKAAGILDPFVRSFTKNGAAAFLKAKQDKDPSVAEAFVSAQDGTKAAFLSKTSNWSHKGKAKHDQPMAGKDWTGPVEVDESTGLSQVQIAVPVMKGGKPIGSLVVGYAVSKLK